MESQEQNPGKTTAETGVRPAQAGAKTQPEPKLLEQVRNVMRLAHYSIHTERSYLDWIKRFINFHHMRSREDLANGAPKIEAFCTDLAVNGKVAPSTQNQAKGNGELEIGNLRFQRGGTEGWQAWYRHPQ